MVSKFLLHALPFLLPFIAFAIYILLVKRAEARGYDWRRAPWVWLCAAGLILTIISLVALPFVTGGRPGQSYVPAELRDGEILPGRME